MSRTVSNPALGPEFNDFLFALLGEDRNGMPLSVVSGLARLDVDPWQEAAALAGMPRAAATERLVSLIDLLPPGLPVLQHPDTVAARLIALLPFRAEFKQIPLKAVGGSQKMSNNLIVLYVIFAIVMQSLQWVAEGYQPAGQISRAQAPSSGQSTSEPSSPDGNVRSGDRP